MDFNNEQLNIKWLPLNYYDDVQLETIFIDDFINFQDVFSDENKKKLKATGTVLWKSAEDSPYQWYHVTVLEYNVDQDTFTIEFENGETAQTQRIYLCFDIEDPKKFIKRISVAFQKRLYADSIIRYKFYI